MINFNYFVRMSQPDYYSQYGNTAPTQQPAIPPGMPPMPPAPIPGMPAFPPGFPMPPSAAIAPGAQQQSNQFSGGQYGATPPAAGGYNNQQFGGQYGQQQNQSYSKPSYGGGGGGFGQQNFTQSQPQQQPPAAKNENRDVIENQVFITGLSTKDPPTQDDIKERFGSIGIIKLDKKIRQPRIKVWPEKGCASVTYEDPSAASAAISWFSGKEFAGSTITVELATKSEEWSGGRRGDNKGGFGGGRGGGRGSYGGGRGGGRDYDRDRGGGGRDRSPRRRSRSRSPGRGGGQKDGDWACPGCNNNNFARRTECNRCGAPKPGGGGGRGGGSGGYERRDNYRGGDRRDSRRDDRRGGDRRDDRRGGSDRRSGFGGGGGRGGGNVRDGDWPCSQCSANNFANRTECFKCKAPK